MIKDDGTDYHLITSLYIEAGHYYVLGNNADYNSNGGVNLEYQYSDISLGNGSDEIILISPQGDLIDSVGLGLAGASNADGRDQVFKKLDALNLSKRTLKSQVVI